MKIDSLIYYTLTTVCFCWFRAFSYKKVKTKSLSLNEPDFRVGNGEHYRLNGKLVAKQRSCPVSESSFHSAIKKKILHFEFCIRKGL